MINTIDDKLLESLNLGRKPESRKDTLGQSDFLKLMTTQLNNQDPLKPMQSGDFFNQIAQFSSVSGIQDLNNSFQQVASAMYSNQALQASAMIGRSVLVPADEAELKVGGRITGSVELASGATGLSVNIFDSAGQLVRHMEMGPHDSGTAGFQWDGLTDEGLPAPPGRYRIRAEGRVDGDPVAATTLLATKVESVSLGGKEQGITLNLEGMGQRDLSTVKQIL